MAAGIWLQIINWTLIAIFGVPLLIGIGFAIYKLWDRKRHNIKLIVFERAGGSRYSYVDQARMWRDPQQKIYFHLLAKKINIKTPDFKYIEQDQLTGKKFLILNKTGPDDYGPMNIEDDGSKIKTIDPDVRIHFVEQFKEYVNKYILKGMNKWIPVILTIMIGLIYVIGLIIASKMMLQAVSSAGSVATTIAESNVQSAKYNNEMSKYNYQLGIALGIVQKNETSTAQPIG